jgi:hypothetical protein
MGNVCFVHIRSCSIVVFGIQFFVAVMPIQPVFVQDEFLVSEFGL